MILGRFVTLVVNNVSARVKGLSRETSVSLDERLNHKERVSALSKVNLICSSTGRRNPVELRNFIAELCLGAITATLFLKYDFTFQLILHLILFAGLIAIFRIDQDVMVIPDMISIPLLGLGLASSALGFLPGVSWSDSLLGIILGVSILYLPAKIFEYVKGVSGLGGGDVKLLAMIGAWISMEGVIFTLFLGALAGLLISMVPILLDRADASEPIPFGPYLAFTAMMYILVGADLVGRLPGIRSIF